MKKNIKYEDAIRRLEEIVSLLEDNNTSLDDSVELYKEGVLLSKICNNKLTNIEEQVAKIKNGDHFEDYTGNENE